MHWPRIVEKHMHERAVNDLMAKQDALETTKRLTGIVMLLLGPDDDATCATRPCRAALVIMLVALAIWSLAIKRSCIRMAGAACGFRRPSSLTKFAQFDQI
jgi:hypothetical protein